MLTRRIIPCLDVTNGRVVKGTNFSNLQDAGDPIVLGKRYWEQGADELVYLDITATSSSRPILLKLIEKVATNIFIPFTIGGGIKSVDNMQDILKAGADKISVNSSAVENPLIIEEGAQEFGSQCIVVAVDVKRERDDWRVYTHGGRKVTKWKAIEWLSEIEARGAGEILLTSIDRDGTKTGFDLDLYRKAADCVDIPIIASGGGGTPDDFVELFSKTDVMAALAASIFHFGDLTLRDLKEKLAREGIPIRLEVEE